MNWNDILKKLAWLLPSDISFLDIAQAIILAIVFFYILRNIYKTRAWVLAKGIITVGLIYLCVSLAKMTILSTIMDSIFSVALIAIVIMLQPELQKIVENVGAKNWSSTIKGFVRKNHKQNLWLTEQSITEIANACADMSAAKTGALIVIERKIPLQDIIESGISLKANISSQLLINTFEKNTPLHDGAVVIKDNRVESATCYLPLSKNSTINKHLGTRHRAAIGASETSDCVVVIVSEETGAISLSVDGKIKYDLSKSDLINALHDILVIDKDTLSSSKKSKTPFWIKLVSPILGGIVALSILGATDPVVTRTITNVPVVMENATILDDLHQVYTIASSKTVTVELQGKRSKIDQLNKSDIVAVADVSEMSLVYAIPIKVSLPVGYEDVEVDTDNAVLKLRLEETEQIEIPVEVVSIGENTDYYIHSIVPNYNTITVTGAKSLIRTLDKAIVEINVESRESNFSENVIPKIYDKNGDLIEDGISLSTDMIRVSGTVFAVKEISVAIDITKQDTTADEYYTLNNVQLENNIIKVAASKSVLMGLEELTFNINPDQATADATSLTIKISTYLPEGIYLAPTQTDELTMSIDVTRYQKLSMKINENNLTISGYDTKKQELKITKMPSIIEMYIDTSVVDSENINLELLHPVLTVSGKAGDGTVQIQLTHVDGLEVVSDLTVNYTITMIGEEDDGE